MIQKSVCIVTRSKWSESPRIRHEIANELSKFYNILFLETPTDTSLDPYLNISQIGPQKVRVAIPPLCRVPASLKRYAFFLEFLNTAYASKLIVNFTRRHDNHNLFLINFNYDFFSIMKSANFTGRMYFCNDDFPASTKNASIRLMIRALEIHTARRADVCMGVSVALVKKLKQLNPNVHLFLPAHNFRIIEPVMKEKRRVVRVAYMGSIDSRLDYPTLCELLLQQDFELHLVGPVNTIGVDNDHWKKLHEKAIFYGGVFGNDLEELLRTMDVFIMPFNPHSHMKNATLPNKVFKYIAAGKPIVVSGLPGLSFFPEGVIYQSNTGIEFSQSVRKAYETDCIDYQYRRIEIAKENTWPKRIVELLRVIDPFFCQ